MNYQYLTRDSNSVTFEDPSNPTSTLVQRRKTTKPVIDGLMVPYVRSEVVINRGVDPRDPTCIKDCTTVQAVNKLQLVFQVGKTEPSITEFKKQWATAKKFVDENIDLLCTGRVLADNAIIVVNPQ